VFVYIYMSPVFTQFRLARVAAARVRARRVARWRLINKYKYINIYVFIYLLYVCVIYIT